MTTTTTTNKMKRTLKESAIASLIVEIHAGRANIDFQDKISRENSNYPSSLEFAKSLLYRAHDAFDTPVPPTPFKNSSEIYNYLNESISLNKKSILGEETSSAKLTRPNFGSYGGCSAGAVKE